MGDHNIILIVMLKHQRNISVTVDVLPSISAINIIVISAQSRRVDIAESDSGCMNMHHGSMVVMGSSEGVSERRGRKFVC